MRYDLRWAFWAHLSDEEKPSEETRKNGAMPVPGTIVIEAGRGVVGREAGVTA